jgi:hypothetical protein
MVVTRDRAEGLALRAFAAAGRAKKEKRLISHHDKYVYTATPDRQTSIVIKGRNRRTLNDFEVSERIFRLRSPLRPYLR